VRLRGIEGYPPSYANEGFTQAFVISRALQPAFWPPAVAKLEPPHWPDAVANLPWAHNVILMEKLKEATLRAWYATAAVEHGWDKRTLAAKIDARFHERSGKAITNFSKTLPSPHSDLAQEATRDPYQFGFLSLTRPYAEREIERQLVAHVRELILELGKGFAFVGSQVHLRVHEQDYYLERRWASLVRTSTSRTCSRVESCTPDRVSSFWSATVLSSI
jgi:predicted nuclease of restriction endonuclease-like (RecB) superfamily